MLIVNVEKIDVRTVPKKDKSGTFEVQTAWVEMPNGERRKIEVMVGRNGAYKPGQYTLSADSFEVIAPFNRLGIRFANLETIREALASVSPSVSDAQKQRAAG